MATKRRKKRSTHKRRRIGAAPTYAAVGKPRRRRHHKVGAHKKRRRIGAGPGGSLGKSLTDYTMLLLGGGIAEVGASMFIKSLRDNGSMPEIMSDTMIGAAKIGVGGLSYHMGKNNPFFQGAGIGLGVSGIKEVAKALLPPGMIGGPDEKTLFVTLDKRLPSGTMDVDYELMGTSSSDAPIIGGHDAYAFSGPHDAPIISGEYYSH